MSFGDIVALALLIAGGVIQVICCLGVLVMRNTLDRLHCVGACGFGAALIAIAVVVQESFSLIGNKALAIAALLLVSNPVLGHVTARSVRIRTLGDWRAQDGERIEVSEG